MKQLSIVIAVVSSFLALDARADLSSDRRDQFGAVVAPAVLPSAASSVYALVGAPDIQAGFRQGFSGGFELELRADLNYFEVGLAVEALAKLAVIRNARWQLAPMVGFALEYDTGARYYDAFNFQYFGLRPRVGGVSTVKIADFLQGIILLDIPDMFTVSPSQGWHFEPVAGGGFEVLLSDDLTAVLIGEIGLNTLKQPLGVAQSSVGYNVRLGLGWRLF